MFNNQIAALLSEKPSSIISQHMDITEDGDPSDMDNSGYKGTGETPWWIWLIIAILILALFTCLAIGMYRKKTGYYKKGQKASQQEQQDVMTDDGLDEPFLTA